MLSGFDPHQIQDLEGARQATVLLLNLVEQVKQENDHLREPWQYLAWGPTRGWRLTGTSGEPVKVEITARPFVHPRVILLSFQTPQGESVRLVLVPDAIGPDAHRRLRALLRLGLDAGYPTP